MPLWPHVNERNPVSRAFQGASTATEQGLNLALAPALTPGGYTENPSFFSGFTTQPQVAARALNALAEITSTRYYNFTPDSQRDPILSAHGDRLRAECFSACNGVYACFELLQTGLDGGEISYGTTNVDLNPRTRQFLSRLPNHQVLHLQIGNDGLEATTKTARVIERKVEMPARWVPALGNVAQLLQTFTHRFQVGASAAKAFLATLPAASSAPRTVWLTQAQGKLKTAFRPLPGSVEIVGMHRLSALKRLLTHAQGLTIYSAVDAPGALLTLDLPNSRFTLALTEEAWRGFSGEGSLLADLATMQVRQQATEVHAILAFEPRIITVDLAQDLGLTVTAVQAGLALLASTGRVGWDPYEQVFFHRELPTLSDSPGEIGQLATRQALQANPRLKAAQQLFEGGKVTPHQGSWIISSGPHKYLVTLGADPTDPTVNATCTCRWFQNHQGNRGPCKHVLAARLKQELKAGEEQ